jgi:hypothetical protein
MTPCIEHQGAKTPAGLDVERLARALDRIYKRFGWTGEDTKKHAAAIAAAYAEDAGVEE